ncbi:DUF2231 domain-containing protein [Streptomyces piniterrae]|uniref:DUF2231 domain-containing protein n=1 Tax=Streptomyces piniterrae TaxID=2571125 RepID=A0A4U0MU52_9ACTN|nr:DUF2231 domain-containing protein [Streptomyces piniterrae]TJZ44499.1 DUF2231 domain-containing protein [Streptomyces piniterrae]
MYSRVTLAGHPVHPMLIAYPVAGYTGTLVGFALYGATGQQFWLNWTIALNIAGVGGALLAAVPGLIDWVAGVPRKSAAKTVGAIHAGLNVAALGLFGASLGVYAAHWDGPATGATAGIVLSAVGLGCTLGAGFLGWTLVQDFHIGVRLTTMQERDELAVQKAQPIHLLHHRGTHTA